MASKAAKSPNTGSNSGSAASLRTEAERLIAKERYKDAVKQAKLCYKEQATPEHHRLLERSYFLRARQLSQQGMRSSAIEVAQHLLDFGVTGSDSPEELIRLLAGLGFEKAALALQERLGGPELADNVAKAVADRLVSHPEHTGTAAPELVQEAKLVRQSLEALQAGDEAAAMAALRDLRRSSPLSEWKFFVRGLAAFQRGDAGEASVNWDRLEPDRAPASIVRRLRGMADDVAGGTATNLEEAERRVFGEPILGRIRSLSMEVLGHHWDAAMKHIVPLRQSLRRIDPKLPGRLTQTVLGSVIKAVQRMEWYAARNLITRFTEVAEPLEIDPRWNRLWALIWDGPHAEPKGAIHYWAEYAKDMETIPGFGDAERGLGRAMIWTHIAELHRDEVESLLDDEYPSFATITGQPARKPKKESPEVAAEKKAFLASVETSLRLDPGYREAYSLLIEAYEDWEDDKGFEAASRRLLARFPDDVETLERLARYYQGRHDPRAALTYVMQARRLKPLDPSLRNLEWFVRVGLARAYSLVGKWEEGRAEFAAADAISPEHASDCVHLVRKAVLEYKAGQDAAADRYVEQARATLAEPGPLWLALLVESIRSKMPRTRIDEYARLWDVELKKKRTSETAGEMADLMGSLLHAKVEYSGRAGHVKKILTYLRKTTTLKYRREDIEHVTAFLAELMPGERSLFAKLVQAGVKAHPDSAQLHFAAGNLQMAEAGTQRLFGMRTPSGARRHLETALKLAESSTDPQVSGLAPAIRERLGVLDQIENALNRFGPPVGGMPDMFDMFGDDFDEDDDDGDFEDEPFSTRPAPAPGRTGRRRSTAPKSKRPEPKKK